MRPERFLQSSTGRRCTGVTLLERGRLIHGRLKRGQIKRATTVYREIDSPDPANPTSTSTKWGQLYCSTSSGSARLHKLNSPQTNRAKSKSLYRCAYNSQFRGTFSRGICDSGNDRIITEWAKIPHPLLFTSRSGATVLLLLFTSRSGTTVLLSAG